MNPALRDLNARLDELEVNLDFITFAALLRPRMGGIIDWANQGTEALKLVQGFMDIKTNRPENLHGALLLRVLAAFERFSRQLVSSLTEGSAVRAQAFQNLPERIRNRNLVLTGRLLASIEQPRDYLVINPTELIENLASCVPGGKSFRLNAAAFGSVVVSGKPEILERAFENLDIANWWDAVGKVPALQSTLGTKGARETANATIARLTELWRFRNMIAHAGDEEITMSESDLRDTIHFVRVLATALDQELSDRMQ